MSALTLEAASGLFKLMRYDKRSVHLQTKTVQHPKATVSFLQIIKEGRSAITKKGQGIDFHMLSSCFTITAKLSNETLIGAHFAHFGKEAGGVNPRELIKIFRLVLHACKEKNIQLMDLQLIGNLDLWDPTFVGLSKATGESLATASVQKAFAQKLGISQEAMKVIDTSSHGYTYLSILPNGEPVMKFKVG